MLTSRILIFVFIVIFDSSCKLSKTPNLVSDDEDTMTTYEPMKYGLFVHYVPGITIFNDGTHCNDLNELANIFDAQAFADDLAAMQVEYIIFTAWHANMNLLYPSEKMNLWRPGHSAKRDMIGDLIHAVKSKGIRVYLYTHPRDGQDFKNDEEKEATGWGAGKNLKEGWNPNWATFNFSKWNNFINEIYGELIDRYGNEIDGLWIDEGSPAGDSYRLIDYDRLRKTIKTRNSKLTLIQNFYGTNYSFDVGMKEYGSGWGEFAQPDGNKWPCYTIPVGAVFAGDWTVQNPIGKNDVQFTAAAMFRYIVLEAGANTNGGGGIAWATGPYAGNGWGTGVLDTLLKLGQFIKPIAKSIKQTLPSTSYPTVSGKTINDLKWGVATRSLDNQFEFIHVLNAPQGKKLMLPVPEDEKLFQSAILLKNGKNVPLKQTSQGIELNLPDNESWDIFDTVIQLTVSGFTSMKRPYSWINDTHHDISYEGTCWEYSRWNRKHGDYDNDVHLTKAKGDLFLFPFSGIGIEYISSRSSEQGKCEIFLDGVYQATIDAYSANYQAQQILFSKTDLNNGKHMLKIINSGDKALNMDVIKIYRK